MNASLMIVSQLILISLVNTWKDDTGVVKRVRDGAGNAQFLITFVGLCDIYIQSFLCHISVCSVSSTVFTILYNRVLYNKIL